MGRSLRWITIEGFRSIRSLEKFNLGSVNVLIGANGSGKSNFVNFFSLLREAVEGRLALAVNKSGGADTHLHLGPQVTRQIHVELEFGSNGYEFSLQPTADNRLIFADERIKFHGNLETDRSIGTGHSEAKLKEQRQPGNRNANICGYIFDAISGWVVYHFHDTSETAAMRRVCSVRDNEFLRPDGANLAAFLLKLQRENAATFSLIGDTVRLVAPFFDSFLLRPQRSNGDETIQLEWKQKGSDYPFHPSQLSDGTLRFIGLATALLQLNPPRTILIDEPELGLHPYALEVLGDLILQAQTRTQLIISTQSVALLNAFDPADVVVIDRENGESRFRRLSDAELHEWLAAEYTLGDLWQKNVYGGVPTHE